MGLADDLAAYPAADEPKYTPATEFDGVTGFIQTKGLVEQPEDFTELLEQFGYDPAKVQIVGHPRTSRWQTYDERWLTAYRFSIAPIQPESDAPDIAAIISSARSERRPANGPHWFVFQASDTQIGKKSAGGSTEEIVSRYVQSIDTAKQHLADFRRYGIEGVQVCMPGDCVEGNQSQNGRNEGYQTSSPITEQVLILQRLMVYTIQQFAPLCEQLFFDVVGGNHDEAQRNLNTWPGNNWATTAATMVGDRLGDNPAAFSHVTVRVPDKYSSSMTVPVGDTVVTIVHGHQWRRGAGFKWWSEQALGWQPAGGAHVLQHGHWHTWEVETNDRRTRISSPTFDCGSDWFKDLHGQSSPRGGLVYLLRSGQATHMSLV